MVVCVLAGGCFIVGGLYFSETIKVIDFCEETIKVLNNEIPEFGKGFSYYFPCYTINGRKNIGA